MSMINIDLGTEFICIDKKCKNIIKTKAIVNINDIVVFNGYETICCNGNLCLGYAFITNGKEHMNDLNYSLYDYFILNENEINIFLKYFKKL